MTCVDEDLLCAQWFTEIAGENGLMMCTSVSFTIKAGKSCITVKRAVLNCRSSV